MAGHRAVTVEEATVKHRAGERQRGNHHGHPPFQQQHVPMINRGTLNSFIDTPTAVPYSQLSLNYLRVKGPMARKRTPTLTDAEARVMSVLWQQQNATVGDVVAAISKTRPTTYSTIQTILRILETKGYVAHEKVARAFVYRAVVDARQARRHDAKHLVSRLFNGSPSLLVLNVLEDEQIDAAELKKLKKLVEEA